MGIEEQQIRFRQRQRINKMLGKKPPARHEWRMDADGRLWPDENGNPIAVPLKKGRDLDPYKLVPEIGTTERTRNGAFSLARIEFGDGFKGWELRYHPLHRSPIPMNKYGLGGGWKWDRPDELSFRIKTFTHKWKGQNYINNQFRHAFEPVDFYVDQDRYIDYEEAVRAGHVSREEHERRMAEHRATCAIELPTEYPGPEHY